jgi:hypothetical protein
VPAELAVPLVARRRVTAPVHGALRSPHTGRGSHLAVTRPTRYGDDVRRIDQRASVGLSAAPGRNELVVREHFVENATRVILVRDRRASMALWPRWSPWLCKPHACGTVGRLLAASARRARCAFREEDDELAHALEALAIGRLGRGSFVFLVSDFLVLPPEEVWREAFERGWDIVPVVLKDPVWERSFAISEQFDRLGLDRVQLAHHDDVSVWRSFHEWSEARCSGVHARP